METLPFLICFLIFINHSAGIVQVLIFSFFLEFLQQMSLSKHNFLDTFPSRNLNAKSCKPVQNAEACLDVVGAIAPMWNFNQDATSNQKQRNRALQMEYKKLLPWTLHRSRSLPTLKRYTPNTSRCYPSMLGFQ